jgi:hypothetical protein
MKKVKVYCKAKFPCEFKRLKRTNQTKKRRRRYFVLCDFNGTCNQQTFERVVEERKEE